MHRKCPFMYVLGCIQHMKVPVYMRMCELQNFCLLFLLNLRAIQTQKCSVLCDQFYMCSINMDCTTE